MSLFARMDAVAAKTIATVHADVYTLRPKTKSADVNAAAIDDPSRSTLVGVVGIYREKEAPRLISNGYDRRTDQRPGLATSIPTIEIDPRLQPLGFVAVRPGDLLLGPDGKTWRVSTTHDDEMGRIHAAVNVVG